MNQKQKLKRHKSLIWQKFVLLLFLPQTVYGLEQMLKYTCSDYIEQLKDKEKELRQSNKELNTCREDLNDCKNFLIRSGEQLEERKVAVIREKKKCEFSNVKLASSKKKNNRLTEQIRILKEEIIKLKNEKREIESALEEEKLKHEDTLAFVEEASVSSNIEESGNISEETIQKRGDPITLLIFSLKEQVVLDGLDEESFTYISPIVDQVANITKNNVVKEVRVMLRLLTHGTIRQVRNKIDAVADREVADLKSKQEELTIQKNHLTYRLRSGTSDEKTRKKVMVTLQIIDSALKVLQTKTAPLSNQVKDNFNNKIEELVKYFSDKYEYMNEFLSNLSEEEGLTFVSKIEEVIAIVDETIRNLKVVSQKIEASKMSKQTEGWFSSIFQRSKVTPETTRESEGTSFFSSWFGF